MSSGKVAVFGVPSAAGGRSPGLARAPFHLREAGLLEAMRAAGPRVVNLSDLSLFPFRDDPEHPRARNVEVAACAARAAADEMTRALAEGFALVLGGDCSLAAGTVAGARSALGQPVGLVFLDADADLNTPETTPSGYLNGMALALALGRGPELLASARGPAADLSADHVALVGYRALDPGERVALGELGLALPAAAAKRLGMRTTAALALDAVANADGPVLVHLDVDVIDPVEMPAKEPLLPGPGLSLEETAQLLTALLASRRVVGLEVTEFDADRDPDGACARKIVALVARAVARRFRG
ncbi:MAG: arginase family protein [Acidobacteria bacterium]|nr:arginase family protein [Acidobacteriota bacterium]